MKIVALVLCLGLAGCIAPREPEPPRAATCAPLPLLPDSPTAVQRQQWTDTVIAMYVACAKRNPK